MCSWLITPMATCGAVETVLEVEGMLIAAQVEDDPESAAGAVHADEVHGALERPVLCDGRRGGHARAGLCTRGDAGSRPSPQGCAGHGMLAGGAAHPS